MQSVQIKSMRYVLLLAILLVSSLSAAMPQVARVTDSGIAQKRNQYIHQHNKNQGLRSLVKAGASVASVAALVGCIYFVFSADAAQEIKDAATENIQDVTDLARRVANLEAKIKRPSFWSKSWFKALGMDLVMSQSVTVLEQLILLGFNVTKSVFYDPTLFWYINKRSHIGNITRELNDHEVLEYELVPSSLVRDFEYSAKILDKAEFQSKFDYEYNRNRVIAVFNTLVNEFEGLIAFMYYKAEQLDTSSVLYTEVHDRARYIYNCVDTLSSSLEKALQAYDTECAVADRKNQKPIFMPLFQGFFNDFKQVVLSFVRIELDAVYNMIS
jgi:hypothetical protein